MAARSPPGFAGTPDAVATGIIIEPPVPPSRRRPGLIGRIQQFDYAVEERLGWTTLVPTPGLPAALATVVVCVLGMMVAASLRDGLGLAFLGAGAAAVAGMATSPPERAPRLRSAMAALVCSAIAILGFLGLGELGVSDALAAPLMTAAGAIATERWVTLATARADRRRLDQDGA